MAFPPLCPYIARKGRNRRREMQKINRLVILTATVAFFGFVAGAGTASAAQTKEARGTVTAVTTSTMTVKVASQDMTFYIDGDTHLEVRRAAKQIQDSQANAKPRGNDFFEAGNPVMVRYREENGKNHAINRERVGRAAPASTPKMTKG